MCSGPNFRSRPYSCIRDMPSCLAALYLVAIGLPHGSFNRFFLEGPQIGDARQWDILPRSQAEVLGVDEPSSHMIRARSRTFRSSRTLPGHS